MEEQGIQLLIQDAKMLSKNQDEKRDLTHIKCYKCGDMGHFALSYPIKLEEKAQATHKRQGSEKQHMSLAMSYMYEAC